MALLDQFQSTRLYDDTANALQFREVYAPAATVPLVVNHLVRDADLSAGVLARDPRGLVSYVNPDGVAEASAGTLRTTH